MNKWFVLIRHDMVFNNISVISWRSVVLVQETGVSGGNHWPIARKWPTLSHSVASSTHRHEFNNHAIMTTTVSDYNSIQTHLLRQKKKTILDKHYLNNLRSNQVFWNAIFFCYIHKNKILELKLIPSTALYYLIC